VLCALSKTGEQELPGLTDEEKPRLRGPKRASKIRKLFNLTKDDDVRKYVNTYRKVHSSFLYFLADCHHQRSCCSHVTVCTPRMLFTCGLTRSQMPLHMLCWQHGGSLLLQVKESNGKTHSKAPKIQRLVTPLTLQRKRRRNSLKRDRIVKVRTPSEAPAGLHAAWLHTHTGGGPPSHAPVTLLVTKPSRLGWVVGAEEARAKLLMARCRLCPPQKKTEQAEYHKLLMSRLKEQRERRSESLAKKRAIRQVHQFPPLALTASGVQ
jgi:hypothetical protein